MKILFVTTHLNSGGIASYIVSLARELHRRNHAVFIASSGGSLVATLQQEGIAHLSLNIRTKSELSPKIIFSTRKLIRFVKENDIDIIHAHTRVAQVVSFLVSKLTGVVFVSTCHGFFKPRFSRKKFQCWGKRVVAISQAVKEHLCSAMEVDPSKIELIYNGIDFANLVFITEQQKIDFKRTLCLRDEIPTVGIIARLSSVKGHVYLIEAIKKIIDYGVEVQLLIVGDGDLRQSLINDAKKYNIEKYVFFAPSIKNISLPLSVIDIFVMPSLQEGLGLSIIEAQARGIPVVASKVGGIPEVVLHERTGLLVEPADSENLASAIEYLLKDKNTAVAFGRNAKEVAKSRFSLIHMVDETEALYRSVVEKNVNFLMEKILVVNVNWLGDVLFSTPVMRALKNAYPKSILACMVVPRCKDILKNNPYVDEIILFDERSTHRSIIKKVQFIVELKKKNFTKAFLLHRSLTRALIVFLTGIPERIGYTTKKRGFLLTKKIMPPLPSLHRAESYLKIVESYGMPVKDRFYEFFISQEDNDFAREIFEKVNLSDSDFVVVINPGGNWEPKRWSKGNFAKLSDALIKNHKAKVIIAGAPKDVSLAEEIEQQMQEKPLILAGKTTLTQLAAIMQRASLVISADSGPMHIACAVGTNVIALYGPTLPSVTGPYGKNQTVILQKDTNCKLPCYDVSCKEYRCMEAITVEDILQYVDRFRR
ncbi:lipopolysaccharide heptosyltransferase II [Candidatus Omnitrophota bacterium]